jgi:DNA-binding NarL/FixJ family response regulator
MTTVLLAHSHPAVRDWVRDALAQVRDVESVAEASNGDEAWHLIQQVRWDIVLIACSLLDAVLAHAGSTAWTASEGVRVVVLGVPARDGLLHRLWRAGVLGSVSEQAAPETIVEAVRAAAHGRPQWTAGQVARAQRWWDEVGSKLEALTGRERQVLGLVAQGLSNRQIAERFSLSVNTVRTHLRNVLSKLGVSNRLRAAMFLAREMGINQTSEKIIHRDDDKAAVDMIE